MSSEDNAKAWLETIMHLVDRLNSDNPSEVEDEIQDGPLSVLVRDGWHEPGTISEDGPEEYEILLTTGGPALRIYGRLDLHGQPDEWPRLQHQDWGTPWTDCPMTHEQREAVATYARQFWFGE